MWRSVLGLSIVPGAVGMVAIFFFLPESPRFLRLVARHNEGVQVRRA